MRNKQVTQTSLSNRRRKQKYSRRCNKTYSSITKRASTGSLHAYPCIMTMHNLSRKEVHLLPEVYISTNREPTTQKVKETLHKVKGDPFEVSRNELHENRLFNSDIVSGIAFCEWISCLYNAKVFLAFCQIGIHTLTITLDKDKMKFSALALNASKAKALLDIIGCVESARSLMYTEDDMCRSQVEVVYDSLDRFHLNLTVQHSEYLIAKVQNDKDRLYGIYGPLFMSDACMYL